MKISVKTPFLHAGENISRTLTAQVGTELAEGKEVHLAFISPSGKSFLSPALTSADGNYSYLLPACVLDRYGHLIAQIILYGENGYCLKSDAYFFEVHPGIDETSAETGEGDFVTLPGLDKRLKKTEERLAGLVPITDAELAGILV